MIRPSLRWVFALVAIIAGIVVLAEAAGSHVNIAAGVGLIAGGVGLVVP